MDNILGTKDKSDTVKMKLKQLIILKTETSYQIAMTCGKKVKEHIYIL